jgi:hypothetical protein
VVAGAADSIKITDAPAGMLVIPVNATDEPNELELSSNLHPVMFTAEVPVLVISKKSAAYGALPLPLGCTSETIIPPAATPDSAAAESSAASENDAVFSPDMTTPPNHKKSNKPGTRPVFFRKIICQRVKTICFRSNKVLFRFDENYAAEGKN